MKFTEHSGGLGREDLRPYFVAQREDVTEVWVDWKNIQVDRNRAIGSARRQYENGTHIMATHRDGNTQFLCSIPRKRPVAPNYDIFTNASLHSPKPAL